jgi:hypothetical protein
LLVHVLAPLLLLRLPPSTTYYVFYAFTRAFLPELFVLRGASPAFDKASTVASARLHDVLWGAVATLDPALADALDAVSAPKR